MGSGGTPGAAAPANNLPGSDFVAFFYVEVREMQIQTQKPLAVVEHHAVSLKKQRSSQEHCPVIHGMNSSAPSHTGTQPQSPALNFLIHLAPLITHISNCCRYPRQALT